MSRLRLKLMLKHARMSSFNHPFVEGVSSTQHRSWFRGASGSLVMVGLKVGNFTLKHACN